MLVQDVMIRDFPVCTADQSIQTALILFSEIDSHIIPVVDESSKLTTIITKNKLLQALREGATTKEAISSFLTKNPVYLKPEMLLTTARTLLLKNNIGHAPIVDEFSKPIGLLSTAQILWAYDLSYERIQSQLSLIFENMSFGLFSVDKNFIITTANPIAEDLLHMTASENLSIKEIHGLEEINDLLVGVLEQNKPVMKKKIQLHNHILIVQCYPLYEKEKLVGSMVITDDWTNFEKIANELRFSKEWEEKLHSAIEMAYDGLILVDYDGVITMVNKGFSDLFSVNENEILGKPASEWFPELGFSEVLSTGVKITNSAKLIHDTQCLITIRPIKNNEQIIGGICKVTYRGLKQLQEALKKVSTLEQQLSHYQKELGDLKGTKYSFADIVGESYIIQQAKNTAASAASSTSTVLLLGESGTGKELFAHGIHASSSQMGRFIQVNCSAIPHELMESEFFGYEDGAFTGAKKGGKKGKLEMAQNGTLFLDEIGDMPLALQSKLLRVLQEKEFEPIGGHRVVNLQTKIIAATNKNLEELVSEGKFREDLFYRLNVIRIDIPPLRKRLDDLPDIVHSIINRLKKSEFDLQGITHSAMTKLISYQWPGNIRELHNIIERAANLTEDGYIDVHHIPKSLGSSTSHRIESSQSALSYSQDTVAVYKHSEKERIESALVMANGNKARASRDLGISRTWLYKKIREYGIE
ncbi:hypothetical protein CSV63_15705 [Sporosarcina sp. P34]|uniref:sigma-54-dependent Fis family transcriptional regulator n=1 Tax=Sporosarcina sp. P34 TaxID=2048247 RepID=UPI000C16823F|nr:sigma-54-dependent Fis family transcriptional regulator [Sporosarcina sp. P34]PID13870.1 hypothetical protein CSV63_15705 [Sporosarcina sp. P34]